MLTQESLNFLVDHAKNATWHPNAFNCRRCPKEGCPAWWKLGWQLFNKENQTHVEKTLEGCGFSLMPILMADVVHSSYRNVDVTQESIKRVDNSQVLIKQGLVAIGKLALNKALQEKQVNSIEGEIENAR